MRIIVTGGAGYIGSQTTLEILSEEHEVCVLDNLCNSSLTAIERIKELTNRNFDFEEVDVCNVEPLKNIFRKFKPEAVIHFAGLKAVGESAEVPLKYYQNNVSGTLAVLDAMEAVECTKIVFSSSATVYGEPKYLPYDEKHPCSPSNAYGRTKYFVEEILKDWAIANSANSAVLLRYFNPVGAHFSGRIGEDPNGIPNNLMPYISQVAVGRRDKLKVFGDDYDTHDGTGVRDYIHVSDLAKAHVAAVEYAANHTGATPINIGTGKGVSVLEMVKAFEKASGRAVPYEITGRRKGDLDAYYADATLAKKLLNWEAECSLEDMCQSLWKWQSENPNGYSD